MTVTEFEDKEEQDLGFQHIKTRISNTLSLPIDDLGKPSGAPTTDMYTSKLGEPKDDLITIFRRMLDLGTPDYEHQLAEFLHKGPPNMDYVWVEQPDTRTPDDLLVASVATKVKAEREAADRTNKQTLIVTNKQDLHDLSNAKFDFKCYTLGCEFSTNDKKLYERHVVTCHYGKGLCYPGKIDIKMRGWTAQGRKWEI